MTSSSSSTASPSAVSPSTVSRSAVSRRPNSTPWVVLGAVLLSFTLLAACDPSPQMPMPMHHGTRTSSQSALYKNMQNLWQQHMEWTYAAVAAFAVDSPGFPATADRLLKNQEDIGNAIKPYYGDDAGNALTVLLKEHINGAVAVLVAAKAGDSAAQTAAVTAEYANAKAIGDFLASANPKNWSKVEMEEMMKGHIDQTLVYATDMLTGGFAQAINDYGLAEAHMVEMGDMLSAGIIAQFPAKFTK